MLPCVSKRLYIRHFSVVRVLRAVALIAVISKSQNILWAFAINLNGPDVGSWLQTADNRYEDHRGNQQLQQDNSDVQKKGKNTIGGSNAYAARRLRDAVDG